MKKLKDGLLKSLVYSVIGLCVLLSSSLACAEPVDFSGTWVLQDRKSPSGTELIGAVPRLIVVKQGEKEVLMEGTYPVGDDKEETRTTTYKFGEPLETRTPSGRKR